MLVDAPLAVRDLAALVGHQEPLHRVHSQLLRAAHSIRPVVESGAVLAACSDEFNGEIRTAFDRDVARLLTAPDIPGTRRVFAVSNMSGRIEPGAIALADLHFTARSRTAGQKLLLVQIASHVGRREAPGGVSWGELDRFGTTSPCCGALRLLLDAPRSAAAVRFPWFDQLTAFFGPERLAALRADASPYAMVRAAVTHAVLQAETAIVDLLREPPQTPTHVLLFALVVVNRRGPDAALPVGLHHLRFEHGEVHIEHGASLRSTPGALEVEVVNGKLALRSREDEPAAEPAETVAAAASGARDGELRITLPSDAAADVPAVLEPEVRQRVERGRRQLAMLASRKQGMRIYARPVLRALLQGLSVAAPEVGLAALAFESGRGLFRAARLEHLIARGPSSAEARAALHDIEPTLQQLGHREAREVLELLLAGHHPLLGDGRGGR
jgi:hypothetical protein